MTASLTRRRFLASTGGLVVLSSARMARAFPANERMRLAVFGDMYNASHFLYASHIYNAQVVALCNPDQRKIPSILKRWGEMAPKQTDPKVAEQYRRMAEGKDVKVWTDVRELFGTAADSIDALVVSHYDHFHGVTCGAALRSGKPVCSERPLGLNISDARALRSLAAETGLPTTYRSPGTGSAQFRRAMELVADGAIGPVEEVHVWFKRGGPDRNALPKGTQPVPEGLDWDLWLAPLPWRDYHPDWMAYAHWRETCSGLGSFGPHTSIFHFLTLGLRPLWDSTDTRIRVRAECSRRNLISFPRWERVRWDLPARGAMPPVAVTWHHGPTYAPGTRETIHELLRKFGVEKAEDADALMKNAGSILVGTKGALVADDHSVHVTALPAKAFEKVQTARPERIPASHNIYRDWMDACRGRKAHILASFDNGGPLSELLMLGNMATQFPEETLTCAPGAGEVVGHAEAAKRLGFPYRDGWKL